MGGEGRDQSAPSDHNTAQTEAHEPAGPWDRWSPFQRILVSTDGTVTRTLEAFTGEEIKCVKLDQSFGALGSRLGEDTNLESVAGDTVIRRTILLRGRKTLTNYVHANSAVLVDRVPVTMVYGMIYTSKPVGLLLAEDRVETTREVLAAGEEPAGAHGRFFGLDPDEPMISRTYRIIVGRRPALLITERFPASSFRALEMATGDSRHTIEGVPFPRLG